MEKELEVKTILVNYMCDDCGEKVEYLDGHMILTKPPKFEHACSVCGESYLFTHKYPYTKYIYT